MAERTHSVRLRLEVDQLKRDADEASKAVGGIGSAAQSAGQQSRGMSRLGEAARSVRDTAVAVGTVAAGAMAALGVAVVRTGISYNTLEQNSRAALTTLLGSAQAATEQMDKLREFVNTALFQREVFIEAQQNMLSFGFAAERVIPVMSALQDAIAATGGSGQRFSEVVGILSRVQSTGQITAGTMNELGRRGINAAQLIGQAMGKTEADIRESISRGALGGREAIEILVTAMEERFVGAAELISNTWVGAAGLVQAGLRNIGSTLVTPFIDPAGGGAAIDWARNLAEVLHAINRQLVPMMESFRSAGEPGFGAVSDQLLRLAEAIDRVDTGALVDRLSSATPVLAGFGVAAATAGSAGVLSAVGLGRLASALSPLTAGLFALAATSPELRAALADLLMAAAPLIPVALDLAVAAGNVLTPAMSALAAVLAPIASVLEVVTGAFAALPAPIQTAVVALTGWLLLGPKVIALGGALGPALVAPFLRLRDEIRLQQGLAGIHGGYQRLGDEARRQAPRLSAFGGAAAVAGRGLGAAAAGARGLTAALGGPWGIAITAAVVGLSMLASGSRDASADVGELAAALERAAKQGRLTGPVYRLFGNDLKGLHDILEVGRNVHLTYSRDQRKTLTQVADAMAELVDSGMDYQDLLDGMQDALGLTNKEMEEFRQAIIAGGPEVRENLIRALEGAADRAEDLAHDQSHLSDETREATAAMKEQADEALALADPMFALHKALRDVEDAQDAYNDAVEEYGPNSREAEQAALDFFAATLHLADAAHGAAGVFDGELTPAQRALLEAAGATEEQIRVVEEAFLGAADAGDKFAKEYNARVNVHTTYTQSGAAAGTEHIPGRAGGFQHGGRAVGPAGVDRIPAWLTKDEHVWTVREVEAAGGHQAVEAMRAAVLGSARFASPVVPTAGASAPATTPSTVGQFEGDLYLDSGQFLGVVRGQIAGHDRDLRRRVGQGSGVAR